MKKSFYRKTASALVLLSFAASLSAQTKRWENNIYEGIGIVNKLEKGDDKQNLAIQVGYGINYYITPKWSVMPGAAFRFKTRLSGHDGGTFASTYIDIPLLAQYHSQRNDREAIVFECGPVLSFLAHGDTYSNGSWFPFHPFQGEKEYKNFDLGVRPAIYYEIGHLRLGLQSFIGLLDTKRKYPHSEYYDSEKDEKSYHTFSVMATISYHW